MIGVCFHTPSFPLIMFMFSLSLDVSQFLSSLFQALPSFCDPPLLPSSPPGLHRFASPLCVVGGGLYHEVSHFVALLTHEKKVSVLRSDLCKQFIVVRSFLSCECEAMIIDVHVDSPPHPTLRLSCVCTCQNGHNFGRWLFSTSHLFD